MNSPFLLLVLAVVTSACAARASAPADYPDAAHIPQGCYVSAVGFIARYTADHPAETGRPIVVATASFPGSHTVALVTHEGAWWVRDEYFGIFSLGARVDQKLSAAELSSRAEKGLRKRFQQGSKKPGGFAAQAERSDYSPADRLEHVERAQRLLSCPSQIVWVSGPAGRRAFLFFSPAPGTVAIYEPSTGTVSAQCANSDPVAVVRTVALRLGYTVKSAELPAAPAQVSSAGLQLAVN